MMMEKHKFNNEVDTNFQDIIKMFKEEELLLSVEPRYNLKGNRRNTRKSIPGGIKSYSVETYGKKNCLETICMVNLIMI